MNNISKYYCISSKEMCLHRIFDEKDVLPAEIKLGRWPEGSSQGNALKYKSLGQRPRFDA